MVEERSKTRFFAQSESRINLVPNCLIESDGLGPSLDLSQLHGRLLVLTLDVNHVTEQDRLLLSVWGSPDGIDWGARQLVTFREREYCGLYSTLLNLAKHPETRYVRAEWKITRSRKAKRAPRFGFSVYVEKSGSRIPSRFETNCSSDNFSLVAHSYAS